MASHRNKVRVTGIFAFREKQQIYADLHSFEWDFANFGPVVLSIGAEKVGMRYIRCGDRGGTAVVALVPEDSRYPTVEEICARAAGAEPTSLERVLDDG